MFELRLSNENANQFITTTYVSEMLLYIEHSNVSATP